MVIQFLIVDYYSIKSSCLQFGTVYSILYISNHVSASLKDASASGQETMEMEA